MSGRQFVDTLVQLGYPKAESLDPQSFEWMFEGDGVVSFLDWFCNNVGTTNILHPKDIQEYEKLRDSEEGVLQGSQLEEALRSVTVGEEEDLTDDQLRKVISQAEHDLEVKKKRKQVLIQKRNKLSLHQTSLSHRLSKVRSTEVKVKSQFKHHKEQCRTDNTQMNANLENLVRSVEELHNLYKCDGKNNAPNFLSQLSLDEYAEVEEKFSQELTTFTKKRFFEGISEIAGEEEEVSRYQILEISDPDSLLIRGERQEVNLSECKELARIQDLYPKSESKRIDALMKNRIASQCLKCAENLLHSIQAGQFGTNIHDINKQCQERRESVSQVDRDLYKLRETDIPSLIMESTSSQVARILTGDYNLKLSRQDYFVSNQDQVISELVKQRSRNEFLTMAFEVETQGHRDTHRLLTAIQQQLQTQLQSWSSRMSMMDEPTLSVAKYQRGTVDSRDKFTTRLHHLLGDRGGKGADQLFLTFNGLVEGARQLKSESDAAQHTLISTAVRHDSRLNLLESNLTTCLDLVYAGSSTTSGQPTLTPRQLLDSMTTLENLIKKLEQSIKDVVKELESKKQTLRNDPLLHKERKMFSYFFNTPAHLKQLFDELSSQLQAHRVN
ncbi:HAUS augmin-like complex subunit 3 [Mizuhopecten yessoensis]|uniref:HAUS augmin-like complex subunit 3 n=1 Tax=Mizuhopecten yessoensis TaxID=6573 RepID=UPI000B4572D4|nr:HAUS augmin-like complex subunit 3 [Mizuhopecten yessoensis]